MKVLWIYSGRTRVERLPAPKKKTTSRPQVRVNLWEDPRVWLHAQSDQHPLHARKVVGQRSRRCLAAPLDAVVDEAQAEVSPVHELLEVERPVVVPELDPRSTPEEMSQVERPVPLKPRQVQDPAEVLQSRAGMEELRLARQVLAVLVVPPRRCDKAEHNRFEPMGKVVERPDDRRGLFHLNELDVQVDRCAGVLPRAKIPAEIAQAFDISAEVIATVENAGLDLDGHPFNPLVLGFPTNAAVALNHHVVPIRHRAMGVVAGDGADPIDAENVSHPAPQVMGLPATDERHRHLDFNSDSARAVQ